MNELGVMLTQQTVTGTETQTAKTLIPILKTPLDHKMHLTGMVAVQHRFMDCHNGRWRD